MSFILTKNAGQTVKYVIEGYVEHEADLATLRKDFSLGSKVVAIDTGKAYVLTETGWEYELDVTAEEIKKIKEELQSLSKLKNWLGDTTTPLYDGSTANPIVISGNDVTAEPGDVARYQEDQFIFSEEGTWQPYDDTLDVYTKDEVDDMIDAEESARQLADQALDNAKVDKVAGKQLSTEDYTTAEKTKLASVADGAEVNVQANWNETNTSSDAFIQNKPTLGTAAAANVTDFATAAQGNKADNAETKNTQQDSRLDAIEGDVSDIENNYLPKAGGALTGDVTTSNTTFTSTSLVTKDYVDSHTAETIVDVSVLPTGAAIDNVIYRLATTVGATTTYTHYAGDATNQTTTELPDKEYVDDTVEEYSSAYWIGTRAEYNELETPLADGTLVFITDDTLSYAGLSNKPSINNIILSGNKSLSDLGIAGSADYIPNAGNTKSDSFALTRNSFNIVGTTGSCNIISVSNLSIQSSADLNVQGTGLMTLQSAGLVKLKSTSGAVEIDAASGVTINPTGNVTINPSGSVTVKGYIPNTGGALTGDVTTSVTEFTSTSLVTKSYVDSAIAAITDYDEEAF